MSLSTGRPTVSVCIVTFNSASDIEDCLHAIMKQSFPVASIVVVDNASQDGTADRVSRFGPPVTLLSNAVNNGFAGGQNQAIARTDSDYVLVLNPDVSLEPDYIACIVEAMDNDPEAGCATGKLVLAERPDVMDSAGLALHADRNAYDLAAGQPASLWDEPREVFGVSGAAAMYRRAMIEDISYAGQFFDEDFFAYKEDVDVAWRARHLGWTACYVPVARAVHRRGWKKGGRQAVPLAVRRHSYQNRFFTLIKNEPAGLHWFWLLPLIAVKETAKLAYIVVREPGLLGSWPVIWRNLRPMLRKRRWLFRRKLSIPVKN
ncbi:MAG TPA: glycosyltransferase family 2 protein [Paenibacillus sp.]|uniref:glycosyltransferase family 2 protein n=1 Tax=Paenibacillus sp. TaxID=58172 RepID=UPI002BBC8983|nr:glycosyltransferase family 2 protein [Paenibacillus sp.]HUC93017.1 glycosyltransferase family 2 protein [Paenibacillus sp.]